MEENKKAAVAVALSAYLQLLSENVTELEAAQGKGKGKASNNDVDLESEIRDQIKLYQDLHSSFTGPPPDDGTTKPADAQQDIYGEQIQAGFALGHQQTIQDRGSKLQPLVYDDDEIIINPFTGLPIIPETGYEAGPSNRPPPPLRKPPKPPKPPKPAKLSALASARPLPPLERFSEGSSQALIPDALLESVPPEQNSPTISASDLKEMRQLDSYSKSNAADPLTRDSAYSLSRLSSIRRKPLPNRHETQPFSSHPMMTSANEITESSQETSSRQINAVEFLPDFDDSNVVTSKDNEEKTGPSRNRYFRNIGKLASKALKAAGNIITTSPTESIRQPAPTAKNSLEIIRPKAPFTAARSNSVASWETLPPAYETLRPIGRSASIASTSSLAPSNILSYPPSRIDTLSPTSTGTITSETTQYQNGRRRTPKTPATSSFAFRSSKTDMLAPVASENDRTPFKPSIQTNPDVNRDNNERAPPWKAKPLFSQPSVASKKKLALRNRKTLRRSAPNLELEQIRQNSAQSNLTFNPPENDTSADELLARALQQEERREAELERDILIAYGLQNNTADDSDLQLAYLMSMEAETLMSTTTETVRPVKPSTFDHAQEDFDMLDLEDDSQLRSDWLKAKEVQRQLEAEDEFLNASLMEARKLQAQYDQQTEDEEAWEQWKSENIDTCIVCGDEHHRDELLRPCDHGYCESCLQEGFKNALSSKTPIRCCQKFLKIEICTGLDDKFVEEYQEMTLELTTPNPIYCSNPRCGKFLPRRAWAGDVATCANCRTKTCKHCRQKHHPGRFCPEDKETEKVRELARSKGWKTCPGCNHLIERIQGCLHMVCTRCQTAFCYRCSKKWNECESTCPDRKFVPLPIPG